MMKTVLDMRTLENVAGGTKEQKPVVFSEDRLELMRRLKKKGIEVKYFAGIFSLNQEEKETLDEMWETL